MLNQIARTKSLRQWWLLPCFYDGKIRGNNDVFLLASLSQFSFLFEKYSGFELSSHDKMKRDQSRHRQSFIGFLQETSLSTKLLFTLWSLCAWINFTPFHCKGRQIMQRILSLVLFRKKLKQNLTDIRLNAFWTLQVNKKVFVFSTYKSIFVWNVVGEFKLVKGDNFGHPLLSCGWTIWMNVHSLWHLGIGFARYYPPAENENRMQRLDSKTIASFWGLFVSRSQEGEDCH